MVRRCAVLTIILLAVASATVQAGRKEHISESIDAEGARRIEATMDFAAGEFTISPDDINEVAQIEVDYDPRRVGCDIEYSVRGSTGRLSLESELNRKRNVDSENNRWDIILSDRYPMSLDMEMAACDVNIDLGGLPLTELYLEIGAASGDIEFSSPNPRQMSEFKLEAGAASVQMWKLGNANFERFDFDGGAGSFELDFRGEYQDEAKIKIEIGLGSAELTFPDDIPIRIETGGSEWFSSVDFHNDDLDEIDDGIYESPGYEDAEIRISLELEVSLGSIDIYFR